MANTNETVTVRLVVAADGALRTLDRFDKEMVAAANASVKASSGVDAFTAHVERMRKAQEAGIPVLKARAAAIQQEERVLQNALGRAEPLYKAQIQAERELARVVAASANLVAHGKMRQEDAIQNIMAVEQAHITQINKVVAAERRAAEAIQGTAASVRASAGAIQAANVSYSRNAFESSNIAMQFQDIAVSAQMGMSPMMIALQQGTQLSAVFSQMRNPLQALPAAFFAIINPVSLLTIGLVGLTAAAAQWLFQSQESAEETETALERHSKMLDELLVGYEKLRDAASEAADAAMRLPEGVIRSDLEVSLQAQEEALIDIGRRADDLREKFAAAVDILRAQDGGTGIHLVEIEQIEALRDLNLTAQSTQEELDAAATAARTLYNTAADPVVKQWANDFFQLTVQLREVNALIDSTDTALRNLPRHIQISLSMSREFGSAMEGLSDLFIDPRSRFDIAREEAKNFADQATATAQSYGELVGVGEEYQKVLESINAAEAEAAEKAAGRGGGGGGGGTDPAETWRENIEAFQQRIAQQEMEIGLVGRSTFEIERQRAAFELLNQAKAAGVPITDSLTASVNTMASEYAQATAQLERMQEQQQQIDQLNSTLASGFSNMFLGILRGTQSVEEGLANMLDQLAALAMNWAFQSLFSGGMGGGGFGFLFNAKGNVISAPALSAYSNQVVSQPTIFPFAKGGTFGVMGEAGPEAIMPLGRDSQGRLGVRTAEPTSGGEIYVRSEITVQNGNLVPIITEVSGQVAGQMVKPVAKAVTRMGQRDRF